MHLSFPEPPYFVPGAQAADNGLSAADAHLPTLSTLSNGQVDGAANSPAEPFPSLQPASDTIAGTPTCAPPRPTPAPEPAAEQAAPSLNPDLQEADSSLYNLLRLIRHEMKTPLTVVRGQLQLLERQLEQLLTNGLLAGTPELVEVEKRIQALREGLLRGVQHSGRLDRLINDIVDLANIQEGHWALKLEHFDLAALLRETVQDAQQLWPTRRLLLNLPDTEEAPVHADEMRIRQVIANYVTNAHKYSPAEHPLEITLHREPQQVGVLVRDHGPGLPFEEQARVWQRFYRVPGIKAQPGEEEGSGLGLTICQQLIAQHHGQVGVFSAPGAGSIFWFTLPLDLPA